MPLVSRKLKVLEKIVNEYIVTGQPVGSKAICHSLNVSSSTIRNDMAELTKLKFLEQPYSSSGRIPSQKGYKFYVEKILSEEKTKSSYIGAFEDFLFSLNFKDLEFFLQEAFSAIAENTGCAVASLVTSSNSAVIQSVDVVPISSRVLMVVLVTSMGVVKHKLVTCNQSLSFYEIENSKELLIKTFEGKRIEDAKNMHVYFLKRSLLFKKNGLLNLLFDIVTSLSMEISEGSVEITGESNLFSCPDLNSDLVNKVLDSLRSQKQVVKLLRGTKSRDVQVLVGNEVKINGCSELSVILLEYSISKENKGVVALIGPTRMNYKNLISNTRGLIRTLDKFLRERFEF
ncbi:MAG: heat-inducible transcriptional repressor HrcA [Oscillospiraceae bacterium]|nr:heat-inducible transcriptional repressor HrcA [Oscillospiraceae bacterium]